MEFNPKVAAVLGFFLTVCSTVIILTNLDTWGMGR